MTAPALSKRAIMQDCAGNGSTLNLTARKLNQTGYAQLQCGLFNTEDKVRKLRKALQLSQSIATISNEQITEEAQKKIENQLEYCALAPVALSRLQTKNGELNKIKKKDIIYIMFSLFLVLDNNKIKKDILMDAFMQCYEKSPTKIPFLVWLTATKLQASPAATAPAARGWEEDDVPFDVGASWDPYNPIGIIDTCL
jgi:hypothetical protein